MSEENKINTVKVSCAVFRDSRILAKELIRLLDLAKIPLYNYNIQADHISVNYEDKSFKFVPLEKVSEV